jgi:hypothetical protein
MTDKLISRDSFADNLFYDPDFGFFKQLRRTGPHTNPYRMNYVPTEYPEDGYVWIKVGRDHYRVDRLAWFFVHGSWAKDIEHIDGDKTNNRIDNLREVTND